MDICVFTITNNMIRDTIISQHKRGVRVRIVTDDEQVGRTTILSAPLPHMILVIKRMHALVISRVT